MSRQLLIRSVVVVTAPVAVVGMMTLLVGLWFGGGAVAPELIDPGVLVRFGLPASMFVLRLASALTLGALLLVAFALPIKHSVAEQMMRVASGASITWVASSALAAFLTFLAVYVEPVTFDDRFSNVLSLFFAQTEIGRGWLWSTLLAGVVSVVVIVARSYPNVFLTGTLAVAALWPLAEQGHAAGTDSHNQAVMASFLHSVFVSFWLGGLIALALVWREFSRQSVLLHQTLTRFSTIALVSAIVVSLSGLQNAWVRVGSWEGLSSAYGAMVVAKVGIMAVLITLGALYRTRLIARTREETVPSSGRVLRRIFAVETAIMGGAIGLAVALSRTPPPTPDTPPADLGALTPAEILTGKPLPPEYNWTRLFTVWELDALWALIAGFAIVFYIWGVVRLVRRGDRWPVGRTVAFVIGMLLLLFATSSGLAVYGMYLFSVHMLGHMLLSMGVPLLLVLGAPVTLAARTIHPRSDHSRGPREWILATVHSRYLEILGHPLIAAPLFALSLIVFYYTPLFQWALENHLGHHWMVVHFVATGYLFSQMLVGVDPQPHRPVYPLRLILVLATMAFHAFFGLSLIMGEGLLVPEWFGAMGREWGPDPLADQQTGGEIAWSLGEIPTLLLAILIAFGWSREGDRESKRLDRQADRDDDQALRDYNEMLQRRAAADARLNRS